MLVTLFSMTSLVVGVRILANPLANVFQKQLMWQSAEPLFVTSATYGFLTVACLLAWPQLRFLGLPAPFWQRILLAGLLAILGNVLLVKALQTGDLSVLGPINAYKSVAGVIIGIFLLHEVPGWWGLLGIGLIIGGSYLVLNNREQRPAFLKAPGSSLRLNFG